MVDEVLRLMIALSKKPTNPMLTGAKNSNTPVEPQ